MTKENEMKVYLHSVNDSSHSITINCTMVKVSQGFIYFYNLGAKFRELDASKFHMYAMEATP